MSKRIILFLSLLLLCFTANAQRVFTLVYAISDDGFVNLRSEPSMKGKVVAQVNDGARGLGNGILIEKGESWSKVRVGNEVGWCYNKYIDEQNWYDGDGERVLIAKYDLTPLYLDVYDTPEFTRVKRGTIIADRFDESEEYYKLLSVHDYILVKKSDVIVRNR